MVRNQPPLSSENKNWAARRYAKRRVESTQSKKKRARKTQKVRVVKPDEALPQKKNPPKRRGRLRAMTDSEHEKRVAAILPKNP